MALTEVSVEAEEFGLKNLTEEQLFDNILEAGARWTDDKRAMVVGAYELAQCLHIDDKHKNMPYTYHLLRNGNRAMLYLHVNDPDVVAAILLHDSVEDHPDAKK